MSRQLTPDIICSVNTFQEGLTYFQYNITLPVLLEVCSDTELQMPKTSGRVILKILHGFLQINRLFEVQILSPPTTSRIFLPIFHSFEN